MSKSTHFLILVDEDRSVHDRRPVVRCPALEFAQSIRREKTGAKLPADQSLDAALWRAVADEITRVVARKDRAAVQPPRQRPDRFSLQKVGPTKAVKFA